MRRHAACAVAAGLLVVLAAAPAHAGDPTVEFTTPAGGQTVTTKDFTFQATVRTSSGNLVGNVEVTLASTQGHGQSVLEPWPTGNAQQTTVNRPVSLGWNGAYQTTLRAASRTSVLDNNTTPRTFTSSFTVDAPAATPGGVKAAGDANRVVTVSWNANTEPDMVGYEVAKQSSSGAWTTFAVTDKTSVADESTATKGGTYKYQVRALRQSAQSGKLNPSPYSSTVSATVAAPPVQPPPTTQPPGGGSGSGGGSTTTGSTDGGTGTGTEGSTGGGGADGGTGADGGSATSGGRRSGAPALATSGKVDLSDFASLLEQSRSQGGTATADDTEDDGTFGEKLPFKARTGGGNGSDDSEESLGEAPASDDNGNPQALGFLAGGLLATVLAMHVLWVRSEVHRAEALEALIPVDVAEAPPAERRRRRPSPAAR